MASKMFQIKTVLSVLLFSALASAQGLSGGGYGFGGNAIPDPYVDHKSASGTKEENHRAMVRSGRDVEDGVAFDRPYVGNSHGSDIKPSKKTSITSPFPEDPLTADNIGQKFKGKKGLEELELRLKALSSNLDAELMTGVTAGQAAGDPLVKGRMLSAKKARIAAIESEMKLVFSELEKRHGNNWQKQVAKYVKWIQGRAFHMGFFSFLGIAATTAKASDNSAVTQADVTGLGSHSVSGHLIAGDQANKSTVLQRFKIQSGSSGSASQGNGQK